MSCDISRWVATFQDEVHSHKRHWIWNWWKLLLMPSEVCAIPECPLLLALYLDTKRRLKKSFLEEIFNIWLYHQCCEFHLQCWWWWDCEILMVKDFTTSSQMSFLRAEAWLGSKMGTGLGSLWNGWDLLFPWHLNLQVEPGLRSVIEDSPCLKTRETPAKTIISMVNQFCLVVIEVLRGLYCQES